jgi:CubicO group peptidase (beta-lactamase class C family)
MAARVNALIPELEAYIQSGMKTFDVPGLAIGIVTGDRLVYAKGFGLRSKSGGAAVDPKTVFQIGSAAKGFLATTMAIAVDRGKFHWNDRVVDLDPDFQLKDPWVTREFRMFDLLAQRSSLPPYANDMVGILRRGRGRDDALAAPCRAGVELPLHLRLHQHHAPLGREDRRQGGVPAGLDRRARAGTAWPARHEGQLLYR